MNASTSCQEVDVLALVGHEAERPGIARLAVEHDERQEIAVPAADERDHRDRREDRPRERQRDVEEVAEVAAAIHHRRVEELARQLLERVAQQENGHREREGDLRQDDAPVGIEQAEIADLDEQRQDRRRHRKQEPELEVAQEESVAEEAQVREGEGRHRREREREGDGQERDQQRIAEHLPVAIAGENLPVVAPHPDVRQAERIRLQVAQFLEAVERGREDRNEHDAREHDAARRRSRCSPRPRGRAAREFVSRRRGFGIGMRFQSSRMKSRR